MSVWYVIPSKRPVPEATACVRDWQNQGYRVALLREAADGHVEGADLELPTSRYLGWARSVNLLTATVLARDLSAEWFVTGGDDYFPDPTKRAEVIAAECYDHFAETTRERAAKPPWPGWAAHRSALGLFGVMQPTGDRWEEGKRCTTCSGMGRIRHTAAGELSMGDGPICKDCSGTGKSAVIDRICGSPWMGREFCWRMYQGAGALYNGYFHNFADQELQSVARKLGVLWQRRDLTQEHRHWARPRGDWRDAPPWARAINDPHVSDWERSKALFAKRQAAGFPGHEPLEL